MMKPHIQIAGRPSYPINTIYGIGRSYAEHAHELHNPVPQEPIVFLKTNASLRHLSATSPNLAFAQETFHHEAEIVLLVGKDVPLGETPDWSCIEAIGLGLDLTRRGVQAELKSKGLPWTTAKSFAGSAVVTEFLPLAQLQKHLENLRFSLKVNGELRQRGESRLLLFSPLLMLRYLASLQALLPGDLVYTGTPAGVGPIKRGDQIELAWDDLAKVYKGCL